MIKQATLKRIFFFINVLLAITSLVFGYLYLTKGGLPLKAAASSVFASLGIFNLGYVLLCRRRGFRFSCLLAVGLIFACLGDIVLNLSFIPGAALFAVGHVFFFLAFSFYRRLRPTDLIPGGTLFVAATAFLLFCPVLSFESGLLRGLCVVYALVISLMVGKAFMNFWREKKLLTAWLLLGSVLFFFSDLMLVFGAFGPGDRIFDILCLTTYYPAEILLATSLYLHGSKTEV